MSQARLPSLRSACGSRAFPSTPPPAGVYGIQPFSPRAVAHHCTQPKEVDVATDEAAYRENAYRVARSMKAVATKREMETRARNLDSAGKHIAAEIFRAVANE